MKCEQATLEKPLQLRSLGVGKVGLPPLVDADQARRGQAHLPYPEVFLIESFLSSAECCLFFAFC